MRVRRTIATPCALALLSPLVLPLVSCMSIPTPPSGAGAGAPRHADGRFRNVEPDRESTHSAARALWAFVFHKPADTRPTAPLRVRALSPDELARAPDRSLYRLGHSTVLLRLRGRWWLIDPVFAQRASPVQWAGPRRFHPPPIALSALPEIAGVILSHDHYDHLDRLAVEALARSGTRFHAPLGVGARLRRWGVPAAQVQEFDWWQSRDVDGVRLVATPAQHFSGRGLRDRDRTLWASWVIDDGDVRLFYSGDSGYFGGFRTIGERFGPFALTLMETGAYSASWPGVHMHPEETLQAHLDVRGDWLLPVHNGTFDLAMHPWTEPLERITALAHARGVRVATPAFGERLQLDAPMPGPAWWRAAAPTYAAPASAAEQGAR